MAGQEGFEPPTSGFGDRRSNQLELLAYLAPLGVTSNQLTAIEDYKLQAPSTKLSLIYIRDRQYPERSEGQTIYNDQNHNDRNSSFCLPVGRQEHLVIGIWNLFVICNL